MFVSKIIITGDPGGTRVELLKQFRPNSLRFIPKEVVGEFLIDDAKAVEKESYTAETGEKVTVLTANPLRMEAQDFLFRLFKEPSKNIKFLIVVLSRNLPLLTIKSYFICEKCNKVKTKNTSNLKLNKMDLKALSEFLQENENSDKTELTEEIALIAKESVKFKDFNAGKLKSFYGSYKLAELNSKSSSILAALLLNYRTKNGK